MNKFALIAATVLVGSAAMPASAATVVNGSFEQPTVIGSPSYGTPAPGVTFVGGAGIEPNGGAFGYDAAPDGVQVAHLQLGGSFDQQITALVAGRSYLVNFLASARRSYDVLTVSVAFNGAPLGTFTPGTTSFTAVSPFRFLATGTTGTLTFNGVAGPGDRNAAIDNVTVAAVPEPATWGMMVLGFGMVGFGLRSRRKPSVRVTYA